MHPCPGICRQPRLIQARTAPEPDIVNLEELEQQAKQRLDQASYDFVAGGAGSELTLRANREAFQKIAIMPRVFTGIKQVDTSANFLGQRLSMPIYVTPMANHGVVHSSAEIGSALGAKKAGTLFVAPTSSTRTIEEVATATKDAPRWFQLYFNKDPDVNKQLLHRAEKAGYSAIVLTVDLPVLGIRDRNVRNSLSLPVEPNQPDAPSERYIVATRNLQLLMSGMKSDLSWDDYEWTRRNTSLPVLIKGILSPDDAEEAAKRKVPAIIVSNHGGRQLDTGFGAIEALGPIVDQVKGRTKVLFDSGIRRGTDVFKAIALGAAAVGVGRPVLWGLALYGADGVAAVLEHLKAELVNVMHLAGTARLNDISSEYIRNS
ncbi:alpha-hydroxy-acid oxidizing protein [Candidatus Bathyarchaeota archaeon]|nr:MAG: alpha-hydroxy-acid oxidizing protein [Candidatus Bathyarchaeota archaeon]